MVLRRGPTVAAALALVGTAVGVAAPLHSSANGATSALTWSTPQVADRAVTMVSVSCVSATFCVAVDNAGEALVFKGSTWSSPKLFNKTTGIPTTVSCASTTFCTAVDTDGNALTYNGTTWSAAARIDTQRRAAQRGFVPHRRVLRRSG